MGKQKYQKKIESLFNKASILDFTSIQMIIKHKKQKNEYTKQLLRNMIKQGKIFRITKGFYSKYEDPSLCVLCFKPCYIGLQSALSFHNLWEQEVIPIVISSKKVRQGIRKIGDSKVLIRRIRKQYLFGFDYYPDGDFYLPYSDLEKTFIDLIYYKQHLDNEVLIKIKKLMDINKLNGYLKKYPSRFRNNVLKLLDS
jgi:predicted transcriptional regulator of viral defense system